MKIAMFGGTFDPIHLSHIALCKACYEALNLDKVILVPTAQPPHKLKTEFASAEHRLQMCKEACRDFSWLEVSDIELQRGGASFTIDTLQTLQQQYPGATWYLLTGADMFKTLQTWYHFQDIATIATFCSVPRGEMQKEELETYANQLQQTGAKTILVDATLPPYSSTKIRQSILHHEDDWKQQVPTSVASYIEQHELYRSSCSTVSKDEQFTEIIRHRLSDYRFQHSLAVAKEAKRLAILYHGDPNKAYTAGLLHDILKDASKEEQLQIADNLHVQFDEVEAISPKLWHARLGSAFIHQILEVNDIDMVQAVRYHTTARANMSLLEKIVYVADFTAEGRDYPSVDTMRMLANQSLESAMQFALDFTIQHLQSEGRTVHPDTFAAYNEVFGHAWKG